MKIAKNRRYSTINHEHAYFKSWNVFPNSCSWQAKCQNCAEKEAGKSGKSELAAFCGSVNKLVCFCPEVLLYASTSIISFPTLDRKLKQRTAERQRNQPLVVPRIRTRSTIDTEKVPPGSMMRMVKENGNENVHKINALLRSQKIHFNKNLNFK